MTLRHALTALAGIIAVCAAGESHATSLAAGDTAGPPAAFNEFCARERAACRPSGPRVSSLPLTERRLAELDAVNRHINRTVREVTDLELYGREDVWAYPVNGMGDCEDFALAKRRDLIAQGWPSSVLLVTVVRDRRGDGHAVLTVVTDSGDLILDNRSDRIRLWRDTPYTYYQRQSAGDPRKWVRVAPAEPIIAAKGGKPTTAGPPEGVGNGAGSAAAAAASSSNAGGNGNSNAGGNGGGSSNARGSGSSNAGGNGNGGGSSNASGNGSAASDGKAGGTASGKR